MKCSYVLERVFRPESNQTLAHFKFRNMKQRLHRPVMLTSQSSGWHCLNVSIEMTHMSSWKTNLFLVFTTRRFRTISLVKLGKLTIVLSHFMRPGKLNWNWPKKLLGIVTLMALSVEAIKRDFKYDCRNDDHRDFKGQQHDQNVITVKGATGEEKGIVQYLAKHGTSVDRKNILELYADPVIVDLSRGQSQGMTWEGQIGPREKILMKLNVRMTWRI